MYFIISGILFSVAYQKKIADGLPFDRFMTKRILRIYPLMVLTSIFMYVGNWLLYAYNGTLWSCGTLSFTELLLDIVFGGKVVFNAGPTLNGPIWYINVLLVCYALAYLLTKLSSKQQSNLVFVLPVLLGLIIQYSGKSFALFNGSAARGFISFFEGVLLASVLKGAPNRGGGGGGAPKTNWGRPPAGNGFAVFMGGRHSPWNGRFIGNIGHFYTFLVFPCVILLLHDCRWINRLCSSKMVKWLGNISFSMYLWNFPIYLTLHLLLISGWINMDVTSAWFLVFVALIHIAAASASYYFIEWKLTNKLAKWASKAHDLSDPAHKSC